MVKFRELTVNPIRFIRHIRLIQLIRSIRHIRPLAAPAYKKSRWPILFIIFLCCGFDGAQAAISLLSDGSGDCPTLQAAFDLAARGDTILLADGVYTGAGNRDLDPGAKGLYIRSIGGNPDHCRIDCEFLGRGFLFLGPEEKGTVLQGITICHGYRKNGGAIRCSSASPEFIDCIFFDNQAEYFGGAVHCEGGEPGFTGCWFDGNNVDHGSGGGIWCRDSKIRFVDCQWRHNSVNKGTGGGVWLGRASTVFSACRFTGNTVDTGSGGAISSASSAPVFENCFFADNSCSIRGGAAEISSGGAQFTRSTFVRNAAASGGALSVKNSNAVINMCTFHGNIAFKTGSAVSVSLHALPLFELCIITGGDGRALDCMDPGSSLKLTGCDIFNNKGGDWVGCAFGQLGLDGNITTDPLFCAPSSDTFHLRPESPCLGPIYRDDGSLLGSGESMGAWPPTCR